MRINWVLSADCRLDNSRLARIKNIGPTWGSWKTWRNCETDNVICDDLSQCRELMKRQFQNSCNFYAPRRYFMDLGRPTGLQFYEGEFTLQVDNVEDIIAMHFVGGISDIVLLLGFDLGTVIYPEDRFDKHKLQNRMGLIRSAIVGAADTQWVLVDHPTELDKAFQNIPNLTCDRMENVIQLLV